MSKIIMLSKKDCPKCVMLKHFMTAVYKDYSPFIEIVMKEEKSEEYQELVEKFNIQSLPVLIAGEEVLYNTGASTAKEFIDAHK